MEGLFKPATQPWHFRFKIESFSSLSSSSTERFESCVFDAGDYKWKLAFYPNGNKERGGEGHLSLYLVMVDDSSVNNLNKEMLVSFSLSVFNQIQNKHLPVQGVSRFSAVKRESGFDEFLSHEIFKDAMNGYLVDDTCMFGAEVFFIETTPKPASLSSRMEGDPHFKYTWKIEKFSQLEDRCYTSETFTAGGYDWNMSLYPKGGLLENGKRLYLFLALANPEKLSPGVEVPVEFSLRVLDQVKKGHYERKSTDCFSMLGGHWGYSRFMALVDLNGSNGYLVKDTCILEAEVLVRRPYKKSHD